MDRQYALVVDAPRQRINVEVENQGHPVQYLPPKNVTGSAETFSYRLGKVGLIDPEVVDFHRRVTEGDKKARKLWKILHDFGDSQQLRNNSFLFERYTSLEGMSLLGLSPIGSHYLSEGESPLVFYDRERPLFDRREENPFDRYFVAGFTDSEVMILQGTNLRDVIDAVSEVYELSGVKSDSREKEKLKEQWRMLNRYSAQMIPPHEISLEVTRREYSNDEVKSKVESRRNEIEMWRGLERSSRQGLSPDFRHRVIIGR